MELRSWRRAVLVVTIALVVTACAGPVTNLPTHAAPPTVGVALETGPSAELLGPLLDERGCVYVGSSDPTTRKVPIWPAGYAFDQGAIVAPGGRQVAIIGQDIALEGGLYLASHYAVVSRYVIGDVPSWCRQGLYWFVSQVVP